MKQRAFFFAMAVVLSVAGALSWRHYAAGRPLDPAGAVTVTASLTLSAAPFWIAQDRGLFAHAGLDAKVVPSDSGKTATEAMLRGEADLAPAAEFKAVDVSFTRKDLRILGATSYMHATKLIALKERGIAAPADLKGKRVGVNLGTSGEYHLARLLTLNGLTRDDIVWRDLKLKEMADALAAGEVDAVVVWPPFTHQIQAKLGERAAAFDAQPGEDYYYLVLGRQEWLAAHGKTAERVMLALTWAVAWMADHPEEATAYMAEKFKVTPADIAADLRESRFAVELPQSLLDVMEGERAWLIARGAKGEPVANVLDLIAFGPLEAAAPGAITMIRRR